MYNPEQTTLGLRTVDGDQLVLQLVNVEAVIRNLLCETVVTQVYRNQESVPIEAVYTFPLASRAVLLGLEVAIGGRVLQGTVVAKAEAEETYEQAIVDGDAAVMLEQVQPGLYAMNVGNILAGEEVRVTIRYSELQTWQGDSLRFRLPTTIAPRYGNPERGGLQTHHIPEHDLLVENWFKLTLTLSGILTQAELACPTHQIVISNSKQGKIVTLATGLASMDRDFILNIDLPESARDTVLLDHDVDGGFVALASFKPRLPASEIIPPKNIKIVVDCSGSMAGDSINQARQAISDILQHLRPEDFFNIVAFGNSAKAFFNQQVIASTNNITTVRRQLRSLEADMGGTEMGPALQAAVHLVGPSIASDMLLITDGQIWEFEELVRTVQASGHRVFTVGVGSAVSEACVRQLASETGGACELVTPNEEMAATIVRHFKRIMLPRADNVSIQWPAEPIQVIPENLGPVHDGDTLHVFARFREQPHGSAALTLTLADGRSVIQAARQDEGMTMVQTINHVEPGPLARMAIWESIRGQDDASAVALAVRYQVITPRTNYLVVAERTEEDRCQDLPRLRKATQMSAAGWSGTGAVTRAPSVSFSKSVPAEAPPRSDVRFSRAPAIDWRQQTSPDRFFQKCGWRHTRWLLPVLQLKSYSDLIVCDLPDRILNALKAIAERQAPEVTEAMIVLAFLQTLAISAVQLETSRNFRRALRKAMKKTPPDERLLAAMAQAFATISADDWGPEYPLIEEDED